VLSADSILDDKEMASP